MEMKDRVLGCCVTCVGSKLQLYRKKHSHMIIKKRAEKFTMISSKKFIDIEVDTTVLIDVSKVNCKSLDSKNIVGRVIEKLNGLKICCQETHSKPFQAQNKLMEFRIYGCDPAHRESSQFSRQEFQMCNYKISKVLRVDLVNVHIQSNVLCNSKSHKSFGYNYK